MNQKVGHAENGIIRVLAKRNIERRPVLFHDHAVQREGQRHPLVLLDAAIIMRVEVRHAALFIERILFQVEAAGVDVRPENREAVLHRARTELEHRDRLFHADGVNLVARFQFFLLAYHLGERHIARRFRHLNHFRRALPLRLALGNEIAVIIGKGVDLFLLRLRVSVPSMKILFFRFLLRFLLRLLIRQNHRPPCIVILSTISRKSSLVSARLNASRKPPPPVMPFVYQVACFRISRTPI